MKGDRIFLLNDGDLIVLNCLCYEMNLSPLLGQAFIADLYFILCFKAELRKSVLFVLNN